MVRSACGLSVLGTGNSGEATDRLARSRLAGDRTSRAGNLTSERRATRPRSWVPALRRNEKWLRPSGCGRPRKFARFGQAAAERHSCQRAVKGAIRRRAAGPGLGSDGRERPFAVHRFRAEPTLTGGEADVQPVVPALSRRRVPPARRDDGLARSAPQRAVCYVFAVLGMGRPKQSDRLRAEARPQGDCYCGGSLLGLMPSAVYTRLLLARSSTRNFANSSGV